MIYTTDTIIRDVRVNLNYNRTDESLLLDMDEETLRLDELIGSKIESSVRILLQAAPYPYLGSGWDMSDAPVVWHKAEGVGSGHVHLPDDFLRLLVFQMSDWQKPVFSITPADSNAYAMQNSKFPGVKGNPRNPVVSVVPGSTGLVLEFHSCYGGERVTVSQFRYIPAPKVEEGTIDIPELLYPAAVNQIAYDTAITLGIPSADLYLKNIKELLQ